MKGSLRDQTLSEDGSRQSMLVGRRTRKHPEATGAAVPTAVDQRGLGTLARSAAMYSFFFSFPLSLNIFALLIVDL